VVRERSVIEALRMLMEMARGPKPPPKAKREPLVRAVPRGARAPRRVAVKRRVAKRKGK